MRLIDFSDWHSVLSALAGLALITVVGMGLRVLLMMTVQERRQRQNRQINERLKVLIAAYKTLGGSFTGDLTVDPMHKRDLLARPGARSAEDPAEERDAPDGGSSDRSRRIRDAVEAALSDVLLLGTEEQVRLAATALADLVAGRRVPTHALVVSLRDFIRQALDLAPIPPEVAAVLPAQGPSRPGGGGGAGSGRGQQRGQGGGGGSGGGAGLGGGMMLDGGIAAGSRSDSD